MHYAERVDRIPHRCSFFPQIGPTHDTGFVISDTLIDNFYGVAVSGLALREIAEKFPQVGLVKRDDLDVARAENDLLRAENEELKAQMEHYDKELDAVSYLKGRGYQPVKKSGRPPAKKVA